MGQTCTLGGAQLNGDGNADVFLAKLDAKGNTAWSKAFLGSGTPDAAHATAVAITPGSSWIVVAGTLAGTHNFGSGTLAAPTTAANSYAFAASFPREPRPPRHLRTGRMNVRRSRRTKARMLSSRWILGSAALALVAAACSSSHAVSSGADSTGAPTSSAGTATTGSGGAATSTGATGGSATTGTGAGTTTGAGGGTATTGTGGSPPVCMPAAGSAVITMDCDSLQLAVLQHTGAASDLRLTGRLFTAGTSSPTCAVIDGVDIVSGPAGSAVVQHLAGGESVPLDDEEELIATGTPPVADIEGRCASDDPAQRFDVYGVVVKGRVDGGTFQANCALAEGGGRWPPALRVTCHKNVDLPPDSGDVSVMTSTFMGMTFTTTQLFANAPHDAGGALQTVGTTLHIIAQRSPFDTAAPIVSHDTTGWMSAVSETLPPSAPASQMEYFASSNLLGTDICAPAPSGPPGPGYVPPPVVLAAATGTGQHGAFSTEIFITQCYASP